MTFLLALLLAQVPTPAPAPATGPLTISFPAHIDISASSAANFARFNHDGFGSFIVSIKCDGTKAPIIPLTADIDADLKVVLLRFLDQTNVTAGKNCQGAIFIVSFGVPSGSMNEVELKPPTP
jgi:hypothetical protein